MKRKTTCNHGSISSPDPFRFSSGSNLQLLGAIVEIVLPPSSLLKHLCALLLFHLFLVLQICYLLILVFHLPIDKGGEKPSFSYICIKKYSHLQIYTTDAKEQLKTNKELLLQNFSNNSKLFPTDRNKLITMVFQKHVFKHVLYEVQNYKTKERHGRV